MAISEGIRSIGFEDEAFQAGHRVGVVSLLDPYRPDRLCKYRPLPGNKYVLVTVAITNTDIMPVVASFSDFSLETDKGRKFVPIIMPDMADDFGAARCPAPGDSETGSLLFEVPLLSSPVALYENIDGQERRVALPSADTEAVA
ncbi:MAG: DUF4352 domain-containing protein [Thermoleophilia bacterium]